MVERSCRNPAINAMVFPNTFPSSTSAARFFWSSSPETDAPDLAWGVNFELGSVTLVGRNSERGVRLVRGGQ